MSLTVPPPYEALNIFTVFHVNSYGRFSFHSTTKIKFLSWSLQSSHTANKKVSMWQLKTLQSSMDIKLCKHTQFCIEISTLTVNWLTLLHRYSYIHALWQQFYTHLLVKWSLRALGTTCQSDALVVNLP